MAQVNSIDVEISVLLGTAEIPVHQLLKMGRGAVIGLDAREDDPVRILANDIPVAEGTVIVRDGAIAISVTRTLPSPVSIRRRGDSAPI